MMRVFLLFVLVIRYSCY